MEFTVEISRGGIKFLVEGSCDIEETIDIIDKVSVFDGEDYLEVEFDQEAFLQEFDGELYDAIEEYKRNQEISAAEMRLDAQREEGWE